MSEKQSLCCLLFSVCKNNLYTVFLHISIKEGETIQAIWFPSLSFLASWNRNFQTIEIVNERYSKHVYTCLCFSYSLYKEKKNHHQPVQPHGYRVISIQTKFINWTFSCRWNLKILFFCGGDSIHQVFFKKNFWVPFLFPTSHTFSRISEVPMSWLTFF